MATLAKRSLKKPVRGRPTQSELEKRKARVLEVAEDLFMTRGYAGTSVSEISKRSRVSPRLIASHFGDKAEIFTQIINARNVRASLLAEETSFGDTLEGILFGAAKFAWTAAYSPGAIRFLRLVVGEGERFETHTAMIAKVSSEQFYGDMEKIFARLKERGLVEISDPARAAKFFIDLIVGYSPPQAAMGFWDRVPDDNELRDKVAFFVRAIAPTTKAGRSARVEPKKLAAG